MNEDVKKWIIKAGNSYKTVKKLVDVSCDEEIITDSVCFHSEQFVEKILKAFLVYNKIELEKNPNLVNLFKQCLIVNSEFEELFDSVKKLSFYSVEILYPYDFYIPTPEEAHAAINHAKIVKEFVLAKLNIDENTLDFPS